MVLQCINGVGSNPVDSLTPNLFNIYINDLPDIFDDSCHPVTLETLSLNCLMFADDILLLSESAEGLQKSLDKLSEFYEYS